MRLSTRSRYGVRLMLQLAADYDNGRLSRLSEIARSQSVSVKYLEQIVLPLKRSRYVMSYRGVKGGHRLARHPGEISVGEVVALLEDGPHVVECAGNVGVCERADECVTRRLWKEASEAFFGKLNSLTFQDLVEQAAESGDDPAALCPEGAKVLTSPAGPVKDKKRPGRKVTATEPGP
ncbi:MAG TPA: Rrf2 family transcriptional regulator [Desulfobacteraceae bacterium]|nr:Rrf2 family transcriptional regulator [Desulfobacteraceae bacterium]